MGSEMCIRDRYGIMLKMQQIAGRVAPGVMAGTRGGRRGRAGGYIPNFAGVRYEITACPWCTCPAGFEPNNTRS